MSDKYEVVNGERIPMRYWDLKLSSKELALVIICITESVLMNFVQEHDKGMDELAFAKLIKGKINLSNKLLKTFKIRQIDKEAMGKLEEAIERLEDLRERTKYIG